MEVLDMFNKRVMALFSVVILLMSLCFPVTAFADDGIEIGKCDTSDPYCVELQKQYGTDSTVLYSTVATATCTNEIQISINGELKTIYVSAKPTENPPVIAPPTTGTTDGTLPDSGIEFKPGYDGYQQVELPKTSMDDILNWATTKGNEIIYVLQIFCQPFAIIIFIIAAFMTLIGCIGKSDMVGKGVWGMVLSVVVYAAVLYAPVILQSFVGWVAS
jgi:hypothetical protein